MTEPAPATVEPSAEATATAPEPAIETSSDPVAEPAPAVEVIPPVASNPEPATSVAEPAPTTESEPAPIAPEPVAPVEATAPADSITPAEPAVDDAPPPAPAASASPDPTPAVEAPATDQPDSAPQDKPARKRSARKPTPTSPGELTLELGGGEFSSPDSDDAPVSAAEVIERVISSDGATRLIATAYIGIGNRLFIRGEGPGLSWEKGVPLQFVSIGKWRWETAEATGTVLAKLYKNDEVECSALGTLTLEPGHQQEVAAKF
jgi:hypothetical protein